VQVLSGGLEGPIQACITLDQKEKLEEIARDLSGSI